MCLWFLGTGYRPRHGAIFVRLLGPPGSFTSEIFKTQRAGTALGRSGKGLDAVEHGVERDLERPGVARADESDSSTDARQNKKKAAGGAAGAGGGGGRGPRGWSSPPAGPSRIRT